MHFNLFANHPSKSDIEKSRINLGNLVKKAVAQLEAAGLDKKRIISLQEQFADLLDDDEFWNHQANSLAILATPESLRTYRLRWANKLTEMLKFRIVSISSLFARLLLFPPLRMSWCYQKMLCA